MTDLSSLLINGTPAKPKLDMDLADRIATGGAVCGAVQSALLVLAGLDLADPCHDDVREQIEAAMASLTEAFMVGASGLVDLITPLAGA